MASNATEGSGNVFADLGLPDAADRQTRTRLAVAVNEVLKARGVKQVAAAAPLHTSQSKVSALVNYRLDLFSVEKLMCFLNLLERDIEIVIRPSREAIGKTSVFALS